MLLSLIIGSVLAVATVAILRKRNKSPKNQYADMVVKHKNLKAPKRKLAVILQSINHNFSEDNIKPALEALAKAELKVDVPEGFLNFKVLNSDGLDEKQKKVIE